MIYGFLNHINAIDVKRYILQVFPLLVCMNKKIILIF